MNIVLKSSSENNSKQLECLYLAATLATELDPRIDQVTCVIQQQHSLSKAENTFEQLTLLMKCNIKRLALIGISEKDLIDRCDGRYSYGRIFNSKQNRTANHLFISDCQVGVNFDGINFHQYYLANNNQSWNYNEFSLGYRLELSNRFTHPNTQKNSVLSSLDYSICVDAIALQNLLKTICQKRQVVFVTEHSTKLEAADLEFNFNTDNSNVVYEDEQSGSYSLSHDEQRIPHIEIDTENRILNSYLYSANKQSKNQLLYHHQNQVDSNRNEAGYIENNRIDLGYLLVTLSSPLLPRLHTIEYVIQHCLVILTNPISEIAMRYLNKKINQHVSQHQILLEIAYGVYDKQLQLSQSAQQVINLFRQRGELVLQDFSWLPRNIWINLLMGESFNGIQLSPLFNNEDRQNHLQKLVALKNQIELAVDRVPTQSQYISYLNSQRINQNGYQ